MKLAGWIFLVLLVVLIILWVVYGRRKEHRFIGLAPLIPGETGVEYFGGAENSDASRGRRDFRGDSSASVGVAASDRLARIAAEALGGDTPWTEHDDSGSKAAKGAPRTIAERAREGRDTGSKPKKIVDSSQSEDADSSTASTDTGDLVARSAEDATNESQTEDATDVTNENSVSLLTPRPYRGGASSPKEEICRRVLEELYGMPFPKVRPSFLKNPDTNRSLELDGYCHSARVGFEFNGYQHYQFPNNYHKNSQEFARQVRRDHHKYKICKRLGIHIIVIPFDVPERDIRDFIVAQLPRKGRGVVYVNTERNA